MQALDQGLRWQMDEVARKIECEPAIAKDLCLEAVGIGDRDHEHALRCEQRGGMIDLPTGIGRSSSECQNTIAAQLPRNSGTAAALMSGRRLLARAPALDVHAR